MKIVITQTKEGRITEVVALDKFLRMSKTEKDVIEEIEKKNRANEFIRFKMLVVPDALENVMRYLLGDNEYIKNKSINSLYDRLDDIVSQFDSIESDIDNMRWQVREAANEVKRVIKEE